MSGGAGDENFRALATGLPCLVFGCRGTGERTWPSPQWVDYTGLSASESVVYGWLDAIHPDDRRAARDAWNTAPARGEYLVEHRIRRAEDREYRWHQTRAVPLPGPPNEDPAWVGSSVDIHDALRARDRIADAESRLRTMVEGVPQLLWRSCDMGLWTWSSPQWCDFTGQTQGQSLDRGWLDAVHPDDREAALAAWAVARGNGLLDVEFRVFRAADGAFLWHRTRSAPVRDEQGSIVEWLGTTSDVHDLRTLQDRQHALLAQLQQHAHDLEREIGERERIEARLLHDAQHDNLTGLYNRAYLMERIKAALLRPSATPCAVLFLDVDRFKLVNDSLGHGAGDRLLIEVAARIRACALPHRTVGRFGGDEFILLVEDVDDPGCIDALARKIISALDRPVSLGEQDVFVGCSIGIVHTSASHLSSEAVLRDADVAMYHAKRNNNGGYAVFTETMRDTAVEALSLRADLRNAVARSEFTLHYQPIWDAVTRQIVGVEALVRWEHPRRGILSPGAFIAIAEEIGLIREIGRWVLREACAQLRRWLSEFPLLDLHLNVNTSGEELRLPGFVDSIREILASAEVEPQRLQIEITESIFLQQPERIGEILGDVRQLGVRIALDDFGTGYSSLSYLDRYQVDTIKIDRSFVAGIPSRPNAVAIVGTIIRLGHAVGLDVVAEGVETDDQLRSLQELGCGLVQGYLLGRPVPPAEINRALTRQAAANGEGERRP